MAEQQGRGVRRGSPVNTAPDVLACALQRRVSPTFACREGSAYSTYLPLKVLPGDRYNLFMMVLSAAVYHYLRTYVNSDRSCLCGRVLGLVDAAFNVKCVDARRRVLLLY